MFWEKEFKTYSILNNEFADFFHEEMEGLKGCLKSKKFTALKGHKKCMTTAMNNQHKQALTQIRGQRSKLIVAQESSKQHWGYVTFIVMT